MKFRLLSYFLIAVLLISAGIAMCFELPIDAEKFDYLKGWKIMPGGYFSGQPNIWSLNVIIGDEKDTPAIARKDIEIPATGKYNLWVRYESCYGFGSVFSISVVQNKKLVAKQTFGRIEDEKYFPFGKGYTKQYPWYWHNTDFVYQGMTVELEKGNAQIIISKDKNQKPAAKRVIDLVYLTDDLTIVPGNDWNWRGKNEPPIISRFKTPIYVRITAIEGSSEVNAKTSLYLMGYYKGPQDTYYALNGNLSEQKPKTKQVLSAGETTGWQKIMVSTVMPAELTFTKKGEGKIIAEIATEKEQNIVKKVELKDREEAVSVIVAIGKKRYEEGLLGKNKALTVEEILQRQKQILDNYKLSGSPAKKLFLCFGLLGPRYLKEQFELALACGANAAAYRSHSEIFGINPTLKGFDTDTGALTVHNAHMTKACYEGDFSALEARYKKLAEDMEKTLGRKIPYRIKLIEEAGPPSFETLMSYKGIKQRYQDYLKSEGLTLEQVEKDTDIAFYHQHRFRSLVFAQLNAKATELIEKYFPAGTKTNSGSIFPSTGGFSTLDRGDDPFLLFKERGVTEFSSEISWGWGGSPDYIGPQVQSYEAALARSLSKYHNCPMGSYLIADGNRGYTGDYVELASYPMYTQDFKWLHYYYFGWISECTFIGCPDVLKGIKRTSYNLGKVEDEILNSKIVPASIAIGWSSSTDIWDLAVKDEIQYGTGNCIYPQERLNLYLILRHLSFPCDIVSEEDIEEGYLDRYKAFIWVGDHIKKQAAEKLRSWVEKGGILISVAGGGFFDHYNKPLETLLPVYGVKSSHLEKKAIALRPKLELLHEKSLDKVSFKMPGGKEITFDIYGYRQSFQPDTGKVIARYQNGEVACVENNFGKGKSIIMGFLPGPTYFKPAIPLKPYGRGGIDELSQFVPTVFKKDVPDIFGYLLSDINRPVISSEPLVEPIVRKSDYGYVIPLINYTGKKLNKLILTLNIKDLNNIEKIESLFSKISSVKKVAGVYQIELINIGKFDCVKIKKGGDLWK